MGIHQFFHDPVRRRLIETRQSDMCAVDLIQDRAGFLEIALFKDRFRLIHAVVGNQIVQKILL